MLKINLKNYRHLTQIILLVKVTLLMMVTRFKYCFTLKDCLFRSVKLAKNADLSKYKYSGICIGFDVRWALLLADSSMGKISLFLELIWTYLRIPIIKEKIC